MTRVRNDLFDPRKGFDRGRSKPVEAVWYLLKCFLFLTPLPVPSRLKCAILRLFGATVREYLFPLETGHWGSCLDR